MNATSALGVGLAPDASRKVHSKIGAPASRFDKPFDRLTVYRSLLHRGPELVEGLTAIQPQVEAVSLSNGGGPTFYRIVTA